MSSSKPTLYSYWQSSCAYRVRIALNLKEIRYELQAIDWVSINEFDAVNPMKQVPALRVGSHTLIESMAIMHYLEESYPETYPLLPQDVIKRCKVREICEVITSGIQPLQNTIVLKHIGEEKSKEWAQFFIERGLGAIEKLLSSSARKYCVGDEITMADCCLVPQVYNARRRFDLDLSPYPNILRIDKELENHPAFVAAYPHNQPDCPQDASK